MSTMTTRVFINGNSQAVRIPAQFRLDSDRVLISRNEAGDLVLHPLRPNRGDALMQALQSLREADPSFVDALECERSDAAPVQERDPL